MTNKETSDDSTSSSDSAAHNANAITVSCQFNKGSLIAELKCPSFGCAERSQCCTDNIEANKNKRINVVAKRRLGSGRGGPRPESSVATRQQFVDPLSAYLPAKSVIQSSCSTIIVSLALTKAIIPQQNHEDVDSGKLGLKDGAKDDPMNNNDFCESDGDASESPTRLGNRPQYVADATVDTTKTFQSDDCSSALTISRPMKDNKPDNSSSTTDKGASLETDPSQRRVRDLDFKPIDMVSPPQGSFGTFQVGKCVLLTYISKF